MKKLLILAIFLSLWQLSASTIIVNSIYDSEDNSEILSDVTAFEDGLMDSLFDSGFIIFSTVNSSDLNINGAEDADFMIHLEFIKNEYNISYSLLLCENESIINSGVIDFTEKIDNSTLNDKEFYYLIGEEVAEQLEQFF